MILAFLFSSLYSFLLSIVEVAGISMASVHEIYSRKKGQKEEHHLGFRHCFGSKASQFSAQINEKSPSFIYEYNYAEKLKARNLNWVLTFGRVNGNENDGVMILFAAAMNEILLCSRGNVAVTN